MIRLLPLKLLSTVFIFLFSAAAHSEATITSVVKMFDGRVWLYGSMQINSSDPWNAITYHWTAERQLFANTQELVEVGPVTNTTTTNVLFFDDDFVWGEPCSSQSCPTFFSTIESDSRYFNTSGTPSPKIVFKRKDLTVTFSCAGEDP